MTGIATTKDCINMLSLITEGIVLRKMTVEKKAWQTSICWLFIRNWRWLASIDNWASYCISVNGKWCWPLTRTERTLSARPLVASFVARDCARISCLPPMRSSRLYTSQLACHPKMENNHATDLDFEFGLNWEAICEYSINSFLLRLISLLLDDVYRNGTLLTRATVDRDWRVGKSVSLSLRRVF